jgi:hypothetical protein
MERFFPEATVTGYEPLVAAMQNDMKDRRVVAAAVKAGAQVIITANLKDFNPLPDGIEAQSADEFLGNLFDLDPEAFTEMREAVEQRFERHWWFLQIGGLFAETAISSCWPDRSPEASGSGKTSAGATRRVKLSQSYSGGVTHALPFFRSRWVRLMKSTMIDAASAACVSSSMWPPSRIWASILGRSSIHDRTSASSKNGSCRPQTIRAGGCRRLR